jgi:multiple sugar transport system substrate-binding protein
VRPAVRKANSLILVLLFAAAAFGGCDRAGRNTIRLWQFWDLSVIQPMVDLFELEHPGIRVEVEQLTWKDGLETIQAALASGRQPDVCELGSSWLPRFSFDGVLEDLTPVHEAESDSFLMWDSAVWQGRIYGLPWLQGPRTLFYNRDLFRRAGLDPDRAPRTWDELLAAAKAIDALGEEVDGFGQPLGERYEPYKNFLAFAWGNGGRILDDSSVVRIAAPETREALEYYLRLAGYSLQGRQEVLNRRFRMGRLGMQISGAWNLRDYDSGAPALDYGVALVPKPDENRGEHASFAGAEILVVFSNSKNTELSIELARFLRGYPRVRRLALAAGSVFPASRLVLQDSAFTADDKVRVFVEQAFTSRTAPAHPGWIEMEDVVNRAVEEVLQGRRAPRWCLQTAADEIGLILARYE